MAREKLARQIKEKERKGKLQFIILKLRVQREEVVKKLYDWKILFGILENVVHYLI